MADNCKGCVCTTCNKSAYNGSLYGCQKHACKKCTDEIKHKRTLCESCVPKGEKVSFTL